MSTLPLTEPGAGRDAAAGAGLERASPAPQLLAAALLLVVLYAAFAHGAAGAASDTRVQVALATLAALAGVGALATGALRFAAPPLGMAGIALLAMFAAWNGITLLWSVAPDATWLELNRAITYALVICLAVLLGASDRRAPAWIAHGFLAVALAVTIYALAQKLLPGLHVPGVFDLNQTGPLPRLQEPFGYWNALALFVALGVPVAIGMVVDAARAIRERLGALIGLELMLLTIAFTYSRGGLIALLLAVIVAVALSGAALRSLMWIALVCVAAVPALVVGLSDHALSAADVPLGSRETAGLLLLAILAISSASLLVAGRKLIGLEGSVRVRPYGRRRIGRALWTALAVVVIAAVIAVALSPRGLSGTVSHAWHSFTTARAASVAQPSRLLSVDSENRWVWWKEALGAFSDRPIAGWGAGSFGVVHLLYRRDNLTVNQPHSVPLQFLAETGLVGALLAIAAIGLLFAAAVRSVVRTAPGSERLLRCSLLAAATAYLVHSLYDWDWDIPGVTLPALIFIGVLVGTGAFRERGARLHGDRAGRAVAAAALALCLCSFALSAELPAVAASKASSAVVAASSSSPAEIARARDDARIAARLNPVSDAGPRAEATIAVRLHRLSGARSDLLEALRRQPTDRDAWFQLAFVESALGDRRAQLQASERLLALDPRGRDAPTIAADVGAAQSLADTPPTGSPTARPLERGGSQ